MKVLSQNVMYQISKWTRPLFAFIRKQWNQRILSCYCLVRGGKFFYMLLESDIFITYLSRSWGWPNSMIFRMLNKTVAWWQELTNCKNYNLLKALFSKISIYISLTLIPDNHYLSLFKLTLIYQQNKKLCFLSSHVYYLNWT